MVSRYCEEFGCTPVKAMWELENDPNMAGIRIMLLRAYAGAKKIYEDKSIKREDWPRTRMMDVVTEIDIALFKESQGL